MFSEAANLIPQNEQTNLKILDLAMTLTHIDKGLVRIRRKSFVGPTYGLPTGERLQELNKKYTFMMAMHTDQPFGQDSRFFHPRDELAQAFDMEAKNNADAIKRILLDYPFHFVKNETYGVYVSEASEESIVQSDMGNAILNRVDGRRRVVQDKLVEWLEKPESVRAPESYKPLVKIIIKENLSYARYLIWLFFPNNFLDERTEIRQLITIGDYNFKKLELFSSILADRGIDFTEAATSSPDVWEMMVPHDAPGVENSTAHLNLRRAWKKNSEWVANNQ